MEIRRRSPKSRQPPGGGPAGTALGSVDPGLVVRMLCQWRFVASLGVGVELVATMIDRGPGASFRWTLHTSDAHGLYERFGFTQPDRTYLERPGTRPTPEHSVTRPGPEPPGTPPATR